MKTMISAVLLTLACAPSANAALMTYNVAGTFTDGVALSGSFAFDPDKRGFDQYGPVDLRLSTGMTFTSITATAWESFDPTQFTISAGDASRSLSLGLIGRIVDWDLKSITNTSLAADRTFYAANGLNSDAVYLSSGTVTAATGPAVPEPGTWIMMIVGFGACGTMVRMRQRRTPAPVPAVA